MWFEMRRENLGFVDRAPVVHVTEALVAAPRAAVFAALTDPASWTHWFPNVRSVAYTSPPPHGLGTIREANVMGTRWVEEIIAWDDGRRFAWTIVRASVPLAKAQIEAFELGDDAAGTNARWTFAVEPRLIARLGSPFAGRTLSRLFDRAMANLGAHLHETSAGARTAR